PNITPEPPNRPAPALVLTNIHGWWEGVKRIENQKYADRLYPPDFLPSELKANSDRTGWFTMFALACFHSFGRTQDGQHRIFIEQGRREGWWQELAESRPPDDVQSWLDRLERWSAPEQFDQSFLPWRRTFFDLYTVSRWLDEYREVILKLPPIIKEY